MSDTEDKVDGPWYARLTDDNLKHNYEKLGSGLTFEEASKKAREWFDQVADADKDAIHYTVKDAVSAYIRHLKVHRSEGVADDTEKRLNKNLTDELQEMQLVKLKTSMLKDWRDGLVRLSDDPEDIRRSKSSANRVLSMLKAALNLAFENEKAVSDKEWRRVKPFLKADEARKLFLTDKQVQRLLDKTEGGFHDLLDAAVNTGARYGELANAKASDFDPKQGILILTGKTGTRDAYLSDDALAVFKKITRNKLPGAWLLTKDDGEPWGKNHHTRMMHEAVKAAKLPRDTVFYSLRHYHISKALLAGIPPQVVAENCGTSVRMIEKHYGKFMASDRREMLNRVSLGA